MSLQNKLTIKLSKFKDGKIEMLHAQECHSFTRWEKILLTNLAATSGFAACGEKTLTYTGLKIKDIYGDDFETNLGYLTNMMYATAIGISDITFNETQFFLQDFIAFADNYELLIDISLADGIVKFSMRSYFICVSEFTLKETCLLGLFVNEFDEEDLFMVSRDVLDKVYECKTDEVYILDYEFEVGSG